MLSGRTVRIGYDSTSAITYGGAGGRASSINLGSRETTVGVRTRSRQRNGYTGVFHQRVTTSSERTTPVDKATGNCAVTGPSETSSKVKEKR